MGNVGLQELLVILGCCVGLLFPAIFLFFLIMALTRKSRGWTIAAVVAGVITLVTFAIGIAYAVRSGMKEAKEQAEPRTFPTSDGVATVRGAPRWRELAIGSADSSLGIGNPYLEQYLVVITEAKADFPEGYTLAEFAPLAAEQAASNVIDLQATEFEEVTVGGLKGLRREVTGKADGLGIFYLNTYLESPGYFHQVMAWTLRENEERYRPVLKEAADSFREVGAAAP